MPDAAVDAQSLALMSLDWLLSSAQHGASGLVWKAAPSDDESDDTLYSGTAGIVLALLEGHRHFGDDRYAAAATRGASTLAESVSHWDHASLYFGLAGMAVALHAVHEQLGEQFADDAVAVAVEQVRRRFDGERWSEDFELLAGNAGVALGALSVGDHELALLAVTPYLRTAEETPHGVNWEDRAGVPSRLHHISHGTLGIVASLAAVGAACGQPELIALALAGAADVVARNEADSTGFLVPHSDPQYRPDRVERFSYGWCHGPRRRAGLPPARTGDGGHRLDLSWRPLLEHHHRVRSAATASARVLGQQRAVLRHRGRPGSWCDRFVERDQDLAFAHVLVGDLLSRATIDADGARWSNFEHRATPSDLEPEAGWASGNAGIARELLRFARITSGGDPAYAISRRTSRPRTVRP